MCACAYAHSPAVFWSREAPKVKWLNFVGSTVLSLTHAAGGCERNWSTHGLIFSDRRKSQQAATLERNVRMFKNMRLRDRVLARGVKAQREVGKEPKEYPLQTGDWSSCDESSDDDVSTASVTMAF